MLSDKKTEGADMLNEKDVIIDRNETLNQKVDRLCELYKVSKIDLLVLSIKAQAEFKKEQNLK